LQNDPENSGEFTNTLVSEGKRKGKGMRDNEGGREWAAEE